MPDVDNHIDAMPTKAFFVDMLVKDIPLDRAVLDLVDNCIDGAKRLRPGDEATFEDLNVSITLDENSFEISDNCGGFDIETAKSYAFRFGRPSVAKSTDYSIGQFGVGMKRALFKFGRYFEIHSTTETERWSMEVDVDEWEGNETWQFKFTEVENNMANVPGSCGTRVLVNRLRPEVASSFGAGQFQRRLTMMVRSHQRQFLGAGLGITFNGQYLTNTDLRILSGGEFKPAVEEFSSDDSEEPVQVRIIAGIYNSLPAEAGWYIVCNGRVILSADRSDETGWGTVAEQKDGIPKYHNQYARFRGIVFFNCRNSGKLPWNTTKTGLDTSQPVWRVTYQKMLDHTRVVIKFLNALDSQIDNYGKSSAPLLSAINRETTGKDVEKYKGSSSFSWNRTPKAPGPKMKTIQYSRKETEIRYLMEALNIGSFKGVGEATFDLIYKEQAEDES